MPTTRRQRQAARQWTQRDVRRRVVVEPVPLWFPDDPVEIGTLQRMVYDSDKYDGRPRLWDHRFDELGEQYQPPVFVDPRSGVILIVGWGTLFDITEAGIATATDERIGSAGFRSIIDPTAERQHVSEADAP